MNPTEPHSEDTLLKSLLGRIVVLDLATPYVCIGTLAGGDHRYYFLDDADLHDLRDGSTTRELYVLASRRHGVGTNRAKVYVRREQVVAFSCLEDVVE